MTDRTALKAYIFEQASSKDGFSTKGLGPKDKAQAGVIAWTLCKSRKLFSCRISHRDARYFTTQAAVDALQHALGPKKMAPAKKAQPIRAGWESNVPMHITKDTKYTIAAPPPAVIYRTNTYTQW